MANFPGCCIFLPHISEAENFSARNYLLPTVSVGVQFSCYALFFTRVQLFIVYLLRLQRMAMYTKSLLMYT
jgi:hypothetical protein